MIVTYVYADTKEEWNCAEWRCSVPARAINRTGTHKAYMIDIESFVKRSDAIDQICAESDIIVIQRNLFGPVLATIQHWKAYEKTVIVDFDDAYDLMPAAVKNYEFWIEGVQKRRGLDNRVVAQKIDPPPLTQFKWGLRLVDAATTPSTRLAEDWRSFTSIYNVPNYIELDRYIDVKPEAHDWITIGWGGSLTHLQSFKDSGVLSALRRVCLQRPNVRVMICSDIRIYEALNIPEEQKTFNPWVAAVDWPSQLAQFDIGIAPLAGAYDQRRSWVKALEYLVMRIPWVASDGPPYHQMRSYGWLVNNTPNAWERILLDMVDHIDDYKAEAAGEPYLYGIGQGIDENIEKVLSTYSTIINNGKN